MFEGCMGCHGMSGEKKALGQSKVIKNMSKTDIVNALKGYQNKTYGGGLKGLMYGQVKDLTNEDIEDIANYLGSI